jgi:hypothetical protein
VARIQPRRFHPGGAGSLLSSIGGGYAATTPHALSSDMLVSRRNLRSLKHVQLPPQVHVTGVRTAQAAAAQAEADRKLDEEEQQLIEAKPLSPPSNRDSKQQQQQSPRDKRGQPVSSSQLLDDPCPTLLNQDYVCEPSIEEMRTMTRQELEKVEHFCVSHPRFGSITWLEPTDVSFLPLDKFVRFGRNIVEVYPDDALKHAVNVKLNRPVEIVVKQCYPLDAQTHRRDKTSDDALLLKFEDKLREATAALGAKFVDYVDGEWRFRVAQF